MMTKVDKFLEFGVEKRKSELVILQAPLEFTTSYQKGTKNAPQAILSSSPFLEDYHIETGSMIENYPFAVDDPINFDGMDLAASLKKIASRASLVAKAGQFPLVLGGEHSISSAVFEGILTAHDEIGVVHFDAHTDLRNEYEGNKHSHACVMRRIRESTKNTLSVGIRSLCEEESLYIKESKPAIVYANEFRNEDKAIENFSRKLKKLPKKVFITFDVDVFDPSIVPNTGTPEPGGLSWYQCDDLLKLIFSEKKVVGADVVELMPVDNSRASDFTVAKLVYNLITYNKNSKKS